MRVSPVFRAASRLLLLTTLLAIAAGCSLTKKRVDPLETLGVEAMYERGQLAASRGNHEAAARTFNRLVARFPFGPYTEQAQIDQAYAQYRMNKPDDAYSTINRFIKTYPTHKHVDYAYYLRGLINFDREEGLLERYVGLDMTQRDQTFLRQAFDDFSSLVRRYPNSRYTPDATQRMVHLRNGMAQAEINIALYYLRQGANVAAANRAKTVIETYEGSPQIGDALAILVRSYHELGQESLSDDTARVLQLNYPNHPALSQGWPVWRSNWWRLIPLSNRGAKPITKK